MLPFRLLNDSFESDPIYWIQPITRPWPEKKRRTITRSTIWLSILSIINLNCHLLKGKNHNHVSLCYIKKIKNLLLGQSKGPRLEFSPVSGFQGKGEQEGSYKTFTNSNQCTLFPFFTTILPEVQTPSCLHISGLFSIRGQVNSEEMYEESWCPQLPCIIHLTILSIIPLRQI